mgnify:FL=1
MLNNRILITGATGFVGKQVIKRLCDLDVKIYLALRPGKENIFYDIEAVESIIYSQDIFKESAAWWAETCKDIDTIIHLAWYAEPGKYLESSKNNECFEGTVNFAKGAVKAGVKRFLGIGTCVEYKNSSSPLEASSPLNPSTPYAKSKVDTFKYLTTLFQENSIEFLWCRLFYLFGEGEDSRRLAPLLRNSFMNGKSVELSNPGMVKDYLNVQEAGKIIANLAINTHIGAYNVCSGEGITVQTFAEKIADEYNSRDLLECGDVQTHFNGPQFVVGVKTDPQF